MTRRLGIFGGTFDPIHYGHLAIAEEAREAFALERVLFVPAGAPPHKQDRPTSPAVHRAAMVAAAIADNPAFELSRIELDRPGPSYTVDTVRSLRASVAADDGVELWFVLSVEALRELPTWHEPLALVGLCRFAVAPRPGVARPSRRWLVEALGTAEPFVFLDGPHVGISASEIRARVAAGRSIRYLVPPPVAAYVATHGLYAGPEWRNAAAVGGPRRRRLAGSVVGRPGVDVGEPIDRGRSLPGGRSAGSGSLGTGARG
ncbi:MAG: putative nicotinate-nucleotide adenylyltransferase [Chloroflexota bacterium]|nr:MAG: putative nicotinate-nucleotide adenylyltransferase [Chloroflexota bacterium]